MIDSHCHLDKLGDNPGCCSRFLKRAEQAGIKGYLGIGLNQKSLDHLRMIRGERDDIWLSIGMHPLDIGAPHHFETVSSLAREKDVVAIGETGLDYHYSIDTASLQKEYFKLHCELACQIEKPLIVHTRAAQLDTKNILGAYKGRMTGVMHCFTESWDLAKFALDMGFYISISGIVTFKNADNVREVAKRIPENRLLIETDAPYLAPVPHRGKNNEPSFLPETAQFLADLRGVSLNSLVSQTTDNFFNLFRLAGYSNSSINGV